MWVILRNYFVFKHLQIQIQKQTCFNRIWTKKKKRNSDIKKNDLVWPEPYTAGTPTDRFSVQQNVARSWGASADTAGLHKSWWVRSTVTWEELLLPIVHQIWNIFYTCMLWLKKHTWNITNNHKHIYLQLNILLMRLHLHLVYISIFYIIRIYSFILQESIKLEWFLKASGKKLEKNRTWLASQGQPTSTESSSDLINLCSAEAAEAALKRSFWGFKKFHGPINRSCLGVDMCHVNSLTWTKLLKACSLVWYLNVI